MDEKFSAILEAAFPGSAARHFAPIEIGDTPASRDAGADLILAGVKTATSSPFWDFPDGHIPFVGALSVLLDGQRRARAICETVRIEIRAFDDIDADFTEAYGEGERTLDWWRREIGDWYRAAAARHGQPFDGRTEIICEWLAVVRRL